MGSYTTPSDQATDTDTMPTHQTLRSLMGLLESEPEERRVEFIVEPHGDLFRTIISEDEPNFYMENETLPLDFNDTFEVNKAPSSFHGKIQATLGSIYQDCLLQNINVEYKEHMTSDIIEEQSDSMTNNSVEPVSSLPSEEVDKFDEIQCEVAKDNIETVSIHTNHRLNNMMLENGMVVSLDVVATDTNTQTKNPTDIDFWEILKIFENNDTELNATGIYHNSDTTEDDTQKMKGEAVKDLDVREDGLELNAWKCRLYRARRKRKLGIVSSELSSLEKNNKRLRLTEEKMVSSIMKIRKYYIQSIGNGNFHINL